MKLTDKRFCVYIQRFTDTNEVFYVGEGTLQRANRKHGKNKSAKSWIIRLEGREFYSEILYDCLTKSESEDLEIDIVQGLISLGFNLSNYKRKINRKDIIASDFTFLAYDEQSPTFLAWNEDRSNGKYTIRRKGEQAGSVTSSYSTFDSIGAHRIVYALHHGCTPRHMLVNHKDGNKTNNQIDNLELVTPQGNAKHAFETGLRPTVASEDMPSAKVKEVDILAMYDLFLQYKTNEEVAKVFGLHERYISLVRHSRRWVKTYEKYGKVFPESSTAGVFSEYALSLADRLITLGMKNSDISLITKIEKSCVSRIRTGTNYRRLLEKALALYPIVTT